jgi:uncharacterized protein YgiM (DUF1202 family)
MENLAYSYLSAGLIESYGSAASLTPPPLNPTGVSVNLRHTTAGLLGGVVAASVVGTLPATAALQRGDSCKAVTNLQNALIQMGHDPGGSDGHFGGKTEYAVLQFQRKNNLTADGMVGPATAGSLGISPLGCNGAINVPPTRPTTPGASTVTARTVEIAVAEGINVRSGPGLSYSIIDGLYNGTVVEVTEESGGWLKLARGGWVAASLTTAASGASTPAPSQNSRASSGDSGTVRITTNGNGLNVRSGPGTSYGIVGGVANGQQVATTGQQQGDWIQLASGGWIDGYWAQAL